MGNIVLLDDLTINKIAAGEVIERPASVVKEMCENSIDAGATNINIEIKNGGISEIKISDNGKGIEKDDMTIAFERHATSKIRNAEDLEKVKSMGFRGEALASIAAISKVTMISKTENASTGYKVILEGGNLLESTEAAAQQGTTITVENLFFNTPVRYKFLKKDFTEAGYIEEIVTKLALVNPNIAIKLVNNGKTIIQTAGNNNLKDVIYSIYGKDIANNILDVEYELEGMKIQGVVGKPEIARSNKSNQIFFVNKRHVKDKTLSAAADKAFKGMLPIGKFGFLVINIDMDPQKVDVNVHPAKLEVRFQEESNVFKAVYYALKEGLLKGELISNAIETTEEEKSQTEQLPQTEIDNTEKHRNIGFTNLFKKFNKKEEEFIAPISSENTIESIYNKRNETITDIPVSATIAETQVNNQPKTNYNEIVNKINEIKEKMQSQDNDLSKQDVPVMQVNEEKEEYEQNKSVTDVVNIEEQDKLNEDTKKVKIQIEGQEEVLSQDEIPPSLRRKNEENKQINQNEEQQDSNEYNDFDKMFEKTFGDVPASLKEKEREMKFNSVNYLKNDNISLFKDNVKKYEYKFVGIAFSTYIMLEIKDELYILDQHAAHERIMYEKVKKNYYSSEEKDSQLMLIPDVITLTHKEIDIARENAEMFEKAGFVFEEFGDNTIKLIGVPNICIELNTKELFLDILDEIDTVARTARQEIEEKFIATIACKAAVKANMSITKEEVDKLMQDLLKLENPFTCPHGRPTAIKLSKLDIEKKISRK